MKLEIIIPVVIGLLMACELHKPAENKKQGWSELRTIQHDNHEFIVHSNGYGYHFLHHPSCKLCVQKDLTK